jgi:enoyl-CoA hydratase/carnithine racemase
VDDQTLLYEAGDGVARVTLNRPDVHNAFNRRMLGEFREVWSAIRGDPAVRAVIVTGSGDKAFCTGIDRTEAMAGPDGPTRSPNPFEFDDPGRSLGPKSNGVWRPVVASVNGMACGGAFYLLGEADVIIAADHATFFDPHVTYGMTSALEPAALARRIPMGEVMRWALLGLDERMSAARALQIGLVSEVVPPESLHPRAHELAARIASKPAVATEGTVRAIWAALELSPRQARTLAIHYPALGNEAGKRQMAGLFESGERPSWELR